MSTEQTHSGGLPPDSPARGTEHVGLSPATTRVLDQFADRRQRLLLCRGAAAGFITFVAALSLIGVCDYAWLLSTETRSILGVAAYVSAGFALWQFGLRRYWIRDRRELARQFESADPRLREQMLSAVELADPATQNGSASLRRYLQHRVGAKVGAVSLTRLLPFALVKRWIVAAIVVACLITLLLMIPPLQIGRRLARAALPGLPIQRASWTELTIVEPSPPSRSVAQGDSVGIVVQVRGLPQSTDPSHSGVTLYWQTSQGDSGQTEMMPRQNAGSVSNQSETAAADDSQQVPQSKRSINFAANLSVGKSPVFYQVTAGDAISLWNTLTPRPRPHVVSFRKTLAFPEYARLPDVVEVSEHGDVTAVIGTSARIEATFDQPVTDAVVRYGSRGFELEMAAIDEHGLRFVIELPIKTPGQYQVDAVSAESGLSNPFGPQYSVTPLPDLPPSVQWSATMPRTRVVSPLQIVSLAASISDDLPLDYAIAEWQVNGGPLVQRRIPIDQAARRIDLQWKWDLLDVRDNLGATDDISDEIRTNRRLRVGDIVRTRVAAVDRRAKRGVSEMIEFLVTDEGFDPDRHERLDEISQLRHELNDWFTRANSVAETLRQAIESGLRGEIDDQQRVADLPETMKQILSQNAGLRDQLGELQPRIDAAMLAVQNSVEAGDLDLISAAIYDFTSRCEILARETSAVTQRLAAADGGRAHSEPIDDQRARSLASHQTLVTIANRGQSLSRSTLGLELTAALFRDLEALRGSVLKIIGPEVQMPPNRFNQHGLVITARMDDLESLVGRHLDRIPESTQLRLEHWLNFVRKWRQDIRRLIDQPTKSARWKEVLSDFTVELRAQARHNLLDGRLSTDLVAAHRDLSRTILWPAAATNSYSNSLREIERLQKQLDEATDSADVAGLQNRLKDEQAVLPFRLAAVKGMLNETARLRRLSPYADPVFAADLTLARRAIDQVTERRVGTSGDGSLGQALDEIAAAIGTIEAANATRRSEAALTELISAERFSQDVAATVLAHPYWLERFSVGLQWSLQQLARLGVPAELVGPAEQTRNNAEFRDARQQFSDRRWNSDAPVPADWMLVQNQTILAETLEQLLPVVQTARETLQKYVASLPELARRAAQETRATAEAIANEDESPADTDRVAEQSQRAADLIAETLQSLADFANQADLNDQADIELARDADAAIDQIADAQQQAQQAIRAMDAATTQVERRESSDAASASLESLAARLEQTANHFENANNDREITESRDALRSDPDGSQPTDAASDQQPPDDAGYEDQFSDLLQANEDANRSAEERLAELEQELQTNEPMQEELDEIALRAAEAAQLNLAKAAREERQLTQTLERTDRTFMEQKRGLRSELQGLADRVRGIAGAQDNTDSLTRLTQLAVERKQQTELVESVRQHRNELRQAASDARRIPEDAPLEEIKQAIDEFSETVRRAAELNQSVQTRANEFADSAIDRSDQAAAARKQHENQARVWQQQTRDAQKRDHEAQAKSWDQTKRAAAKRVGQAQSRERSANNELRNARSQEKRKPGSATKRIAQAEQKIGDAKREAAAAKALAARAQQMKDQAIRRSRAIATEQIPDLDDDHPLADLMTQSTAKTGLELAAITEDLAVLAGQSGIEDQLRTPGAELAAQSNRQERILQTVAESGELLQRAARHQQRLGQTASAIQLAAAADQISTQLDPVLADAKASLSDAASQPRQAPGANAKVQNGRRQIEAVAAEVRAMLDRLAESPDTQAEIDAIAGQQASQSANSQSGSQSGSSESSSGSPSPGSQPASGQQSRGADGEPTESDARQLAEMLDELDRSLNSTSRSADQTAAQASAAAQSQLQSQAQRAAQNRQQKVSPSPSLADDGPPSAEPPTDPSTQPGGGGMPPGDSLSTAGIEREDSAWGQLRQQKSADAIESRGSSVAPQYRREVQAYFEALARRAASRKPIKQRESSQ